MAYDEQLAGRVRRALARHGTVTERRMFGGIAFMLRGNMCCGVLGKDLVVRVGPERYKDALALPYARPMDFTGRALKGFVYVGVEACRMDAALGKWMRMAADFVSSLPPKMRKG